MGGLRNERIAHNQARLRTIDEHARDEGMLEGFLCECGDRGCAALLHLPLATYEAVRAHPGRFVIRPGHELLDAEDVVQRAARFFVVEQHDGVA